MRWVAAQQNAQVLRFAQDDKFVELRFIMHRSAVKNIGS
jgi:hypothetical protein